MQYRAEWKIPSLYAWNPEELKKKRSVLRSVFYKILEILLVISGRT
jgi:hypothetical protein